MADILFNTREVGRTSQDRESYLPQLRLRVLHAAPTKYRTGTMVYADGTDWNPGAGEGVYVRTSAAWVKL